MLLNKFIHPRDRVIPMAKTPRPKPQDSIQPLNLGNVVSAAFRLYKTNFKSYVGLAAKAVLWVFVPFMALVPVIILAALSQRNPLVWLLLPAWLVFFFYCIAKSLANSTAIYRLAYQELIDQRETGQQALKFTHSRRWSFLLAGLWSGLLGFGVMLGIYLVTFIVAGLPMIAIINGAGGPNRAGPGPWLLVVLIGLVAFLLVLTAFLWFSARMVITDVALAVEPNATSTSTISRGWSLTHKSSLRIMAINFVAGMIAGLMQVPFEIPRLITNIVVQSIVADSASNVLAGLTVLIAVAFSLLGNILIIPFGHSLKTVIYYDLRSRREGLGLRLRDR
jgi:hypothetical protein